MHTHPPLDVTSAMSSISTPTQLSFHHLIVVRNLPRCCPKPPCCRPNSPRRRCRQRNLFPAGFFFFYFFRSPYFPSSVFHFQLQLSSWEWDDKWISDRRVIYPMTPCFKSGYFSNAYCQSTWKTQGALSSKRIILTIGSWRCERKMSLWKKDDNLQLVWEVEKWHVVSKIW